MRVSWTILFIVSILIVGIIGFNQPAFSQVIDVDGDGIINALDICPKDFDPLQTNSDGDVNGDACDGDINNDGIGDRPWIRVEQDGGLTYRTVASDPFGNTFLGGTAFLNIDDGHSLSTDHDGFASLTGIDFNRITLRFTDLELVFQDPDFGDPATLTFTEVYEDIDSNATFEILLDGGVIATGTDFSLTAITDVDGASPTVGLATGYGMVMLTGPVGSSFYDEVISLSPSGQMNLRIESFVSISPTGIFDADGYLYIPDLVLEGSLVPTSTGETVNDAQSDAAITIPAGVLASDTAFAIDVVACPAPLPVGLIFDSVCVNFNPDGTTFAPPGASLRIPLNLPLTPGSIIDLLKFNPGSGMFEDTGIDGLVDASGTTATATGIASLSTYAYASSNVVVVGGTSLPIDSTSLLLAGVSVNAWMIPVVLSAAGFGILIARKI